MARATSPTSTSSATTRRSTRERKPTAKALESLQQQQRQPSRRSKNAKTEAQDDAFPTDLAGLNGPEEAAPVEAAPKPARAKKAPVKEAPVKKQPVKKQPAKKGTAKKGTAKKDPMKKEPVQKESAKKQAEKKKPTKKESVEKEPVKKQPVKEQTEKKEPAKKEPAKKESVKKQPVKKPAAKPTPVETPAPVPAPAAPTTQAVAKPGSKKAKKTVTLGNTKVSKKTKPTVLKIKICMKRAGLKLYECAVQALGPDFKLPSDPEQLIAEARRSFERSVGIAPEESPVPNQTPADDGDDELDVPTIKKYKKSAPPRLQSGWVLSGRANDNGEEVTLSPSTISPYRSPNTYGDEALPQPPIRSRTVSDVEKDNALGFPPLLGDRNIPFGPEAQFQPEDVTEVQARVKTRGKARQKKDSGSAGPTETGKKSRARKQRETEATSKVEASVASSTPGDGNTKPAQRRHGARAPKAAAIKTESEAPVVESDKPKITRIRLTLKPQASADVAPPTATPLLPCPGRSPQGHIPEEALGFGGQEESPRPHF
ncbi:hypothetical protein N7492_005623 [Penicillium capsulatum]|uniref:Uncharacterized protein n=1 Tax=Penicillium capsulatum TaxID=69766 RepID=A0A9W9ICL6_9EURO|nr:hypothetical protein N7492_005623 [Penicillium capsulatum]